MIKIPLIPINLKLVSFSLALTAAASASLSADNLSYAGGTYTGTFDAGLPSSSEYLTWVDGDTFEGWYSYKLGGTGEAGVPDQYRSSSVGYTSTGLARWRASASATDGALGTKPLDSTGAMITYLVLVNNTSETITSFTLSYTGEQWYDSDSGQNNQLVVAYQVGATDVTSGDWTTISDLTFNSIYPGTGKGSIDGSDAANQTVFDPETIGDITWEVGETLIIRWYDSNSSGTDQGLGIDDVIFSTDVIPESATYSVIVAVLALAVGVMRRRRR